MLTDKEIGELWAKSKEWYMPSVVRELIENVLRERKRYHDINPEVGGWSSHRQACHELGIPPEDFNAK